MEKYPLLTCGFFNNRIATSAILYATMMLGLSKLILLVKPMVYHAADHDRIAKWLIGILMVFLVQDTIVYLTIGNIYYCHADTSLRYAAIYNMTVDKDILNAQKISKVHGLYDASCTLTMFGLEIFITSTTCFRLRKYKKMYNSLRKLLKINRADVVEEIEMNNLRSNSREIAWADNTQPAQLRIVMVENTMDNSRKSCRSILRLTESESNTNKNLGITQ